MYDSSSVCFCDHLTFLSSSHIPNSQDNLVHDGKDESDQSSYSGDSVKQEAHLSLSPISEVNENSEKVYLDFK